MPTETASYRTGSELEVGDTVLVISGTRHTISEFTKHPGVWRGRIRYSARIACSTEGYARTVFDTDRFQLTSDGAWIDTDLWLPYERGMIWR